MKKYICAQGKDYWLIDGQWYFRSSTDKNIKLNCSPVSVVKRAAYVFDLDGTLFDSRHRDHLVPQGDDALTTAGWSEWNKACHLDEISQSMKSLVLKLYSQGYEILYVTARCVDAFKETLQVIRDHNLPVSYGKLHMREWDDNRSSGEVKVDKFNDLSSDYHIVGAFDDDPDVTGVLCDAGYNVMLV